MKNANVLDSILCIFQFALLPCHIKAESQVKDGIANTCGSLKQKKNTLINTGHGSSCACVS